MKQTLLKRIPPKYLFSLMNLRNMFKGFKQIHYSQNGEDIMIHALCGRKRDGVYVDVGAHHPKRYSNTYQLYKRGWRGINIDPNPETIGFFNHARPEDTNMQVGIAAEKGELEYFMFSDPAVNTFSKASSYASCDDAKPAW